MTESHKIATVPRTRVPDRNGSSKVTVLARGQLIWHPRHGCGVVTAHGSAFAEVAFGSGVRLQVPRYVPHPPTKRILKQIADVLSAIAWDGMDVSGLKVGC